MVLHLHAHDFCARLDWYCSIFNDSHRTRRMLGWISSLCQIFIVVPDLQRSCAMVVDPDHISRWWRVMVVGSASERIGGAGLTQPSVSRRKPRASFSPFAFCNRASDKSTSESNFHRQHQS